MLFVLETLPASATLRRYTVRRTSFLEFNAPNIDLIPFPGIGDAIIDGKATPPSAALLRLKVVTDSTTTDCCPAGGYIFQSINTQEGPAAGQVGAGGFGSSIAWGTVTGWTITGSLFCHAVPAFFCGFAGGIDVTTVDPSLHSSFYDLGTWTFHATGFTAVPFVYKNLSTGGNEQWILRGWRLDRFLPALPLGGIAVLGGSLLALSAIGAHRSRPRH